MIDDFDAIIFDCDGVLVNSEEIALEVELERLADVGLHYPRDPYVRRFLGMSQQAFMDGLREDARERLAVELPDTFFQQLKAAIRTRYESELMAIAGAAELAAAWPKAKAVASSSSAGALTYKLTRTNLAPLFGEHVYSADAVSRAKPDPALFLHSAERLRVAPDRCLVIEDSANGVMAARRAGMRVLGFTGGGHCSQGHGDVLLEHGAERLIACHGELLARLSGADA